MPGFNQRGPMNDGPMTGRKRGTCTDAAVDPGQGFADRGNGGGMGRGRGNRGCQAPGRGMAYGRKMGYGQWASPAPTQGSVNQDTLQDKVNMLEAELSAIKNQLKMLSEQKD